MSHFPGLDWTLPSWDLPLEPVMVQVADGDLTSMLGLQQTQVLNRPFFIAGREKPCPLPL